MLSQAELKELLNYDPLTGIFIWKISNGKRAAAGRTAGGILATGYIQIRINAKHYLAHRLAWLFQTGTFPPDQIDHINGIRDDNRYTNLREAKNSQNCCNSKIRKNNTSGMKGVSWHKQQKKWRASIVKNNKQIFLGLFDDPALAHLAYCNAAEKLHQEFANFG